ncbi:MAG: extracellular solute-binding protein [Pseudomonadota bacterium]
MTFKVSRRQVLRALSATTAMSLAPSIRAQSADEDTRISALIQAIQRLDGEKPEALRVLAPTGAQANLAPITRAFTAATGIGVDIHLAPVDDINTRLLLDHMSQKTPFDLAVVASFGVPDLVAANALLATDQFERKYPVAKRLRQQGLYRLADQFGGNTYGPQVDGDLYVIFYNTEMLKDADFSARFESQTGRKVKPAESWEQLDTLMRVAHEPARNRFGGLLFRTPRYIVWEFWSRLHAAGILPFDADMRPQLTDQRAISSVEALVSASNHLHPRARSASLVENWEIFAQGNTLCNIGWGGSQKYFVSHADRLPNGLTMTQLPGVRTASGMMPLPYFNWGWNLTVPIDARHPELGFLLSAFATAPSISTQAVAPRDGFFDPFQPAHYNDSAIREAYGDDFLAVHQTGLQGAIPDLYIRGHGQYIDTLSSYLMQADRGLTSPLKAMQAVSNRWNIITRTLGLEEQKKQWRQLLNNYPPSFLAALDIG